MKSLKLMVSVFLVSGFAGNLAAATAAGINNPQVQIVSATPESIVLSFDSGDLQPGSVSQPLKINPQAAPPAAGITWEPGKPVLPMVSRFVAVPPHAGLELHYNPGPVQVQPAHTRPDIVSSENPSTIIADAAAIDYGVYPSQIAEISEPFVIRGVRLVKVTTYPLQFDSRSNTYISHPNIEVEIRYTEEEAVNPAEHPRRGNRSRQFLNFIRNFAVNGAQIARDNADEIAPYLGHYLVVTHENCLQYAAPFIEWRRKSGYRVDLLSLTEDDALNPNSVKQLIQERYDAFLDGGGDPFDMILLIGDRSQYNSGPNPGWVLDAEAGNSIWWAAPHADYLYACLEGNDHYPEAGFARFPSGSEDLMQLMVNKTLAYEESPHLEGEDWFTKGAVFSQHWGLSEISAWHVSINTNVRWGVELLEHLGFEDIVQFEDFDWDQNAVRIGAWMTGVYNEGRNILIGRAQLWNWRNSFEGVEDNVIFPIHLTTNGIGDWAAENMMRSGDGEHLKGPVATTFAWGDTPTIPMSYTWLQLVDGMLVKDMSLGWARVNAITSIERYISDFQYGGHPVYLHIKADIDCYGDPGIQAWIGTPQVVEVEFPESITPFTRLINVHVFNPDNDEDIENARVTLYAPGDIPAFDNEDYAEYDEMVMYTGLTDAEGNARIVVEEGVEFTNETPAYLSVTGRDVVPNINEIQVAQPEVSLRLEEYAFAEVEGNGDEVPNPGESFDLDLTALNDSQEEMLPEITAVVSSESPWVEIEDRQVSFGDLEAGESAAADAGIRLDISAAAPDGATRPVTSPVLTVDFTSGENHWQTAIKLDISSPNLEVREVVDGIVVPVDISDLDIDLENRGRIDSGEITAILRSRGGGIAVIQNEGFYGAIAAGEHFTLEGEEFVISGSELHVPGTLVPMELILSTEDGFVDTAKFELQLGEAGENTPMGPDEYGYFCFDDADRDWQRAPEYDWIEINPEIEGHDFEGDAVDFEGESQFGIGEAMVIPLGFTMQFYGTEYDSITIGTNGFIAPGSQPDIVNFQNWNMEQAVGGGAGMIAPFWDWLMFGDESAVFTFYDEDAAQFIVEWYRLSHYPEGEDDLTFQVIIYNPEIWINESGTSDLLFQYQSVRNIPGPNHGRGGVEGERNNYFASVGISSPPLEIRDDDFPGGIRRTSTGISYTWLNTYPINAAPLADEMAILFSTAFVMRLGAIQGHVRDAETGEPISGARVITSFGQTDITDEEGFYRIEQAIAEIEFDLTAYADGYNPSSQPDIYLDENEVLNADFELTHPEFVASVDGFSERVLPGEAVVVDFEIINIGNGPLDWIASTHLVGDADRNPWELRQSIQVGEIAGDTRILGAVFIYGYYYVSGANDRDPLIYIFNRNGDLVNSFRQPVEDRYGMRDLAWDGELIWGAVGDSIYGIWLDGAIAARFESEYNPTNNITWDSENEILWVSHTASNIIGYDREGNRIEDAELSSCELRIYGLAYYPDDPDGYNLYAYHKNRFSDQPEVIKFDTETGDTMTVHSFPDPNVSSPLGAFITREYDKYSWVFIGCANAPPNNGGDRLDVWQLDGNKSWMTVSEEEGHLLPDMNLELTLTLDAESLEEAIYAGELHFRHNAAGGLTVLPIEFDVNPVRLTENDLQLPEVFGIVSACPNPFNAQVLISFNAAKSGLLSLKLYDVSGREVAVLHDDYAATGLHSLSLAGEDFASGVYLLKLQAGKFSQVRKLILMR